MERGNYMVKEVRYPLVTVGMTVYNAKKFLPEALDSIREQDYPNLEIVISDNASTDGSSEYCIEIAERDSRIRYHRNPINVGAVGNWNNALALASGEYFMWAADHDTFEPSYVSKGVDILEQDQDCVLVYSKTRLLGYYGDELGLVSDELDTTGLQLHDRYARVLWHLKKCTMIHGVQRTDLIKELGGFPDSYAMDLALLPVLAIHGSFRQVKEPLFCRRENRKPGEKESESVEDRLNPALATARKSLDRAGRYRETRNALLDMLWRTNLGLVRKIHLSAMTYSCYWARWRVGFLGLEHILRLLPTWLRRSSVFRGK